MAKHRSKKEIAAMVKAIDKRRAKSVPMAKCYRAQGIAEQSYYRWRFAASLDGDDVVRRFRDLSTEVDRLTQGLVNARMLHG